MFDDDEFVLNVAFSLCVLLTAATQERRFCFTPTTGSTAVVGRLQEADGDITVDDEDMDLWPGAGQKFGSAVLILRPFSSYLFLAAAIFLLCCFNSASRLAS